jgi:hypothetical protein
MDLVMSSLLTLGFCERKKKGSSPEGDRSGGGGGGAFRGTLLRGASVSRWKRPRFGCGWAARAGFVVEIARRERHNVDDRCQMGVEA